MKFKVNYFQGPIELTPRVALYKVYDFMGKEMPGLAIILDDADGQYEVFSVSFGEFIGMKNATYIDTNNCPYADQILATGIAKDTGFTKHSGFCEYPLWVFDENFLREHGAENYQKYSDAFDEYMREM